MRLAMLGLLAACVVLAGTGCCAAEPDHDFYQGNWEGQFTSGPNQGKAVTAQVVTRGRSHYRTLVNAAGAVIDVFGDFADDTVSFSETVNGEAFSMKVTTGKAEGALGASAFSLARVEKKPPTLGQQPPEGAVVLLDGKTLDAWRMLKEGGAKWDLVDAVMQVRPETGNTCTTQDFGDVQFHIEFRTPLMAGKAGQARGNSGVYIQGRYEVQVLDSFGLPIRDNECGGIYKKATPKVNACLPPQEWQTYDITFHAPQFDAAGNKTKNARITVVQNGITIHDDVELDGPTPGGIAMDEAKAGPLLLQDHGCLVQYRNIWAKPL